MTIPTTTDVTEQKRLNDAREAGIPWKKWGPYLSERQWGTVREDYSDNGFDDESTLDAGEVTPIALNFGHELRSRRDRD